MLSRSHTLKSARLKERRRKVIIGRAVLALFGAGGLWGLIFWFTGLPVFTIKTIEVEGTVSVSPSDIASSTEKFMTGRYWFTVPRANVLFYPKKTILEDILKAYPRVENAEVRFRNFHTLHITITEREAAALWCRVLAVRKVYLGEQWDDCFLMDKNGFIFDRFEPSEQSSPDVMKFMTPSHFPAYIKFYDRLSGASPVGETYLSARQFQSLLLFARNLEELEVTVSAFRERPDQDLDTELVGGGRLVISPEPEVASLVSNLRSIISEPNFGGVEGLSKLDYIDMRFGNKVFYLLK